MSEKNRIVVEGFSFSNEAEAAQAGKEAEGIKYIREKIKYGYAGKCAHRFITSLSGRSFLRPRWAMRT